MTAVSSVKVKKMAIPMGNKMLVLPVPIKEQIVRGIIIPISATSQLEEATVVAVSDDTPMHVQVGDCILMPRGTGVLYEFEDVKYMFVNGPTDTSAGDVWAIV